jgi:hypothetical protein
MAGQQPRADVHTPFASEDIQRLIEELEQACRESRELREQVESAMKTRCFWPERRQWKDRHPS